MEWLAKSMTPIEAQAAGEVLCLRLDFVLSRAEMNGLLVVPGDGKVDVKAPDTSAKEVLTLIYGATILEFGSRNGCPDPN